VIQPVLQFQLEVLEDQRQLNGSRYVSLEGLDEDPSGDWTVTLNFGQAKDLTLEEADLSLAGPRGRIFAGLDLGSADIVTDDVGGDEVEQLDIALLVSGGEGDFADVIGEVHVRAELSADRGRCELSISIRKAPTK
jgi:hypothetical protein